MLYVEKIENKEKWGKNMAIHDNYFTECYNTYTCIEWNNYVFIEDVWTTIIIDTMYETIWRNWKELAGAAYAAGAAMCQSKTM